MKTETQPHIEEDNTKPQVPLRHPFHNGCYRLIGCLDSMVSDSNHAAKDAIGIKKAIFFNPPWICENTLLSGIERLFT
jgi:hypothetical protein